MTGGLPSMAPSLGIGGWPSAKTRLAGVIGHPVSHSLSPRLHQTAYRALGVDWAYLAFDVEPASLEAAIRGARALGAVGLSVTMPHKESAARLATRRSAVVRRLGAANTLTFSGSQIAADNTDGTGLLADLRLEASFEPRGRRCAVIGAGGAARAVILALAEAGASEVLVVNRTRVRAFQAVALVPGRARVARREELETADLIVNATPASRPASSPDVGEAAEAAEGVETAQPAESAAAPAAPAAPALAPGSAATAPALPGLEDFVDSSRFGSGQLVVDLVYDPPVTEWLARAAANGARVRGGLGMLVYQAALQIELWTGSRPPLTEMWRAVGRPVPTRP